MHQKRILVLSRRGGLHSRISRLVQSMDAKCDRGSEPLSEIPDARVPSGYDLVVVDASDEDIEALPGLEAFAPEEEAFSLLLVVGREQMEGLRIPVQIICDFADREATDEEMSARIRHLLWPGEEASGNDFIRQGSLTLNLATYQVKIDGEPVDFTYLEYALLAFLVTHPGRTYSRDALLNRVWDFDYYGGSRTVDVHVRRIRAKLGPDLAQHLKTVRGVGYLWSF